MLPGKSAEYPAVWSGPILKEGKYKISCEIKYGKMYGREKTAKLESSFEIDGAGRVIIK